MYQLYGQDIESTHVRPVTSAIDTHLATYWRMFPGSDWQRTTALPSVSPFGPLQHTSTPVFSKYGGGWGSNDGLTERSAVPALEMARRRTLIADADVIYYGLFAKMYQRVMYCWWWRKATRREGHTTGLRGQLARLFPCS